MTEPNLFDVRPKAKRKASPPVPGGAVQRLIGVWARLFEQKFREKPVIVPADGAALKRLIMQAGPDVVERRLAAFLKIDDEYLSSAGYPLRLMPREWNRLIALERQADRSRVPNADKTAEYLRDLKGGRG